MSPHVFFILDLILLSMVDRKLVEAPPPPPPSNFIAGRCKAAILFWIYDDFRCGMLLFRVSVAISVSPHVCFILDLILISMFLR